ncbi:MAG TPA: ribosome maturation factor RimM, partial [Bacillales bacterium]|nr:ribosome maturation factor RimM [Bacillales bacterium]
TLYADRGDGGDYRPLVITARRRHKQFELLCFQGYDHINDVEPLKGAVLKVPEDQLSSLDDDEYYYHEIIGCRVVTDEGEKLGEVKEILSTGANDVWVVKATNSGKEVLIPYIDDVVKSVDIGRGLVEIHPMEGLIE